MQPPTYMRGKTSNSAYRCFNLRIWAHEIDRRPLLSRFIGRCSARTFVEFPCSKLHRLDPFHLALRSSRPWPGHCSQGSRTGYNDQGCRPYRLLFLYQSFIHKIVIIVYMISTRYMCNYNYTNRIKVQLTATSFDFRSISGLRR